MMSMKPYEKLIEHYKRKHALNTLINQELSQYQLAVGQWMVLNLIHNGQRYVTDLATSMQTSMANITNTINVLQKRGYVSRSTSERDHRQHELTFTGDEKQLQTMNEAIELVLQAVEEEK